MNQVSIVDTPQWEVIKPQQSSIYLHGGTLDIWPGLSEWIARDANLFDLHKQIQEGTLSYVPLKLFDLHNWRALNRLEEMMAGCFKSGLFEASGYDCGILMREHSALVPLALLTTQPDVYREKFKHLPQAQLAGVYLDDGKVSGRLAHSARLLYLASEKFESLLGTPALVLMGTGYKKEYMPMHGESRRKPVIVNLSNGDQLLCACWVWYPRPD